jgi:3-methyladenine DNA glycosylase AlkD
MKPEELYDEIMSFCKSNADEAIVKKYSKYFREGVYDAYGLTQELQTCKVKEILSREDVDYNLIRETSKILVRSGKYEGPSFAVMLYHSMEKQFNRQIFDDIASWYETGINNWAHGDYISIELVFPLLKKEIISYNDLKNWIAASNKFQRRAVPVSLIKTLKYTPEFQNYFGLIEPLMIDPEREVHQGIGWFLREAWKKQPDITEIFLMKWKEKSPRLIFQYACEKMSPEGKNRFRRTKL